MVLLVECPHLPQQPAKVFKARVTVRQKYELPIEVAAGGLITYRFTTVPKDIGFGVTFKPASGGNELIVKQMDRGGMDTAFRGVGVTVSRLPRVS
jgi:hypothetical protein